MKVQSRSPLQSVSPSRGRGVSSPASPPDVAEVGADKTGTQHAGNMGIGLASAASVTRNLKTMLSITSRTPVAKLVPGLNIGVATVEGLNFLRSHRKGDHVVAATHLGNSLGCLAAGLEESGALAMSAHRAGLGASLALVGGALGLGVGLHEIKLGQKLRQQTGSNRTLTMGLLDAASGISSLGAAALSAGGMGQAAVRLLLLSGLIDLAGIGVDYYGERIPLIKGKAPIPPAPATPGAPQPTS